MPEIEAIKAKPYDETTIAEAIVLFLAALEDEDKLEALERISYLKEKEYEKESKKILHLGLEKE